jgi:integrase
MATEKVGIYRSYYGPVPVDKQGRPLPKSEWPHKRPFSWVVRWFNSDGQRYSRSFPTRKEADLFAEEKQSEARQGKVDPVKNITLKEFTKEHLVLIQGQITYRSCCDHKRSLKYLMDIVGDCSIRKITPHHAELYIKRRIEAKVSASSINKEIACLRRIFNLAIDRRGYLPEGQNPFKKVEKRRVARKPVVYIPVEDFKKLLAACRTFKWKVLLSLLYTAGLRIDEARNLTWMDIDFEQGILNVAAKRDAKHLIPWEPKDHELRHIPLGYEMLDLLAKLQAEVQEGVPYIFLTAERYAWVLDPAHRGAWNDSKDLINNMPRQFRSILKRAKLFDYTFHDLRRSCITNWARHLPAHVVRKLAGHSSLETTMRYYLSVQENDLIKAKDLSDQLLIRAAAPEKSDNPSLTPTDQKLTNSAKKGIKTPSIQGGHISEDVDNT